jgi:uncharacterized protein YjiS (DUF1127 family)
MAVTTFTPRFAGQSADGSRDKAAPQAKSSLSKPRLSMIGRLVRTLQQGMKRRAAIRALGALDARMLADIGIDPSSIEAETDAMLARAERRES